MTTVVSHQSELAPIWIHFHQLTVVLHEFSDNLEFFSCSWNEHESHSAVEENVGQSEQGQVRNPRGTFHEFVPKNSECFAHEIRTYQNKGAASTEEWKTRTKCHSFLPWFPSPGMEIKSDKLCKNRLINVCCSSLQHQMNPSSNFGSYRASLRAALWRAQGAVDDREKVPTASVKIWISFKCHKVDASTGEKKLPRKTVNEHKCFFRRLLRTRTSLLVIHSFALGMYWVLLTSARFSLQIVVPFFSLFVKDMYFLNEGCSNT